MIHTETKTDVIQTPQPETQLEVLDTIPQTEIVYSTKDAIIGHIDSCQYDYDLKTALVIATMEHFDSDKVIHFSSTCPSSGSISVISVTNKLWATFNEYRDYRAKNEDPIETEVETDFRTRFIFEVIKTMADAGLKHQIGSLATKGSLQNLDALGN